MTTEIRLTNAVPVQANAESAEFFAAARRGEFLLHRDASGTVVPPQDAHAYTGLTPFAASGRGVVVTSSVVYGRDASGGTVPKHTIGIVELAEGPWWWTELITLDDVPNEAVLTGCVAELSFVPSGPDETHEPVPVWVVTRGARDASTPHL